MESSCFLFSLSKIWRASEYSLVFVHFYRILLYALLMLNQFKICSKEWANLGWLWLVTCIHVRKCKKSSTFLIIVVICRASRAAKSIQELQCIDFFDVLMLVADHWLLHNCILGTKLPNNYLLKWFFTFWHRRSNVGV